MSVIYKKNYLDNVIFRVDFDALYKINDPPSEFQEKVKEKFPIPEQKELREYTWDFIKKEQTDKIYPLWIFYNLDKSQKINISYKFFSLEFTKYHSFPEFKLIIEETYNNFIKIYNPPLITRFGLRYINKIVLNNGNPFDWSSYINSSLTHPIDNFFEDKKNLSRAITQVSMNCGDYNILFSYGFYNSEYPNRISRKEFVLDYDCSSGNIEPTNVIGNLETYNSIINDLFERSIDSKLKEEMNK